MNELITQSRKEKIKVWFKDYNNLILIGILVLALSIFIYYFFVTKHQPLWWDEAEYMSTAKHLAFGVPYDINPQRPPLFPFLAFLLFKIGLGEGSIKILLEIFPALLAILATYLLVKEMYNKKTALITSFIMSVSWIHIFYTMRFMTDAFGFLFGVLSFFCFWRGYVNQKGRIFIWLTGLFVILSFLSRLTGIIYGIIILAFLITTCQFNFLKNKDMWISFLISLIALVPYLLWCYNFFGNAFAFRTGYGGILYSQLGWWMLGLIYDYPELGFFILFLVGLITIIPMFLVLDKLIFKKDKTYYNDFFMILTIIFTEAFFIYFLRQGENRWLIMMSMAIFTISAKGILLIYDIIKKNIGKTIAILLLVVLLLTGAYFELNHADMIIKNKVQSYAEVRDAGLWLKENTPKETKVLSISYTQTVYYSERNVSTYSSIKNDTEFNYYLDENRPDYLTVSVFESHPAWIFDWVQQNYNRLTPVQVYTQSQNQTLLVIYKINYNINQSQIS